MVWNPYSDQKNRAYTGILTSLFPEQTKTLPRILVWSIIFLADLILGIGGAVYFGLLMPGHYRSSNGLTLAAGLVMLAIVGIFWLQGKIWYGIATWFQNRNRLD